MSSTQRLPPDEESALGPRGAQGQASSLETEELFRLLVESAEDYAIFLLDPDGRVASWNAGAHRMKGYRADEVIGRHFSTFYPPDAVERGLPQHVLETARAEGRFENEGWRVRKDGSLFWANVIVTPLWRNGLLCGFSKITRDLTERRRVEEELRSGHELLEDRVQRRTAELTQANEVLRAEIGRRERVERDLRESEARVVSLMELMPVAVYTCEAPSGIIRYFNRHATRLWGREPALGETDERFCGSFRLLQTSGAPLPHAETPMARVLGGGPPVRDQRVVIERPDGTRITVLVNIDPITDDVGELVGAINAFQDVSERERLFEDLRERAEEIEKLMEVMPVAVWIARDPECRTISGNAAGYEMVRMAPGSNLSASASEATTPFRVLLDGREARPHELPMQYAAAHGVEVRGVEEEIVFDDGLVTHVFGSATPLFDEAGQVRGSIAAFMNVSEMRRLDRELRQKVEELAKADRRKNEFLAVLAHELRNPLAPIRNGLELLRLSDADAEARREIRALIDRQVSQMVRLIDDLLDVSRITSNKLQLRKERILLSSCVQSAVEAARPQIEAAEHELTVTLPDDPIALDGDAARLSQAFTNLLSNAAKYTDQGGQLWLTAERQGGEVVVSVRDTGIGIEAADLPRLFDMFSQVKPSADRSDGGLGIGLSLVRSLVELHGGTVGARSDGPGRGSEFEVRLPIAAGAPPSPGPAAADEEQARAPSKGRVLVADDNRDATNSLATLLELSGYEVKRTFDGVETIQAAAAFRPEVALLDIGMPKADGYEVARAIRREPWGATVVLVAITGWGQEADKRRAIDAGFDHHFVKPVHLSDLERLLATIGEGGKR